MQNCRMFAPSPSPPSSPLLPSSRGSGVRCVHWGSLRCSYGLNSPTHNVRTHRMYTSCNGCSTQNLNFTPHNVFTKFKVFQLYNLSPTLLTLRYLAFQEVCIRYKLESTPHTAEIQQICKYICNTTHNNLQREGLQVDRFHLWTVAVLHGKHSTTKAPQASLHKPKD